MGDPNEPSRPRHAVDAEEGRSVLSSLGITAGGAGTGRRRAKEDAPPTPEPAPNQDTENTPPPRTVTFDDIDFLARAITPPGRPRRFDARFLVVDARLIAKRIDGAVHSEAELVELVWTPLAKARSLDLPDITHSALDDLAQALEGGFDKRRPRPFYREIRGKRLREHL